MKLYHATTKDRAERIRVEGLRVSCADPAAKIKGCWLTTASLRPWAVLHTIRKHRARLEDVVIIEANLPHKVLKRFKTGLWYTQSDVAPERLGAIIEGLAFSASASK